MGSNLDLDDAAGQRMHIGLFRERDPRLPHRRIAVRADQLQLADHRIAYFAAAPDRQIHLDLLLPPAEQRGEALQLTAKRIHHRAEADAVAVLRQHFRARHKGLRDDCQQRENQRSERIGPAAHPRIGGKAGRPLPKGFGPAHLAIAATEAAPTSPLNSVPVMSRSRAQNSPRFASIGT